MDCVFCQILDGNGPASMVFEDDLVAAFMDIQPVNPGHLLVVPRQHAASLAQLNPEHGARIWRTGQRLARALYQAQLKCEGLNFFLADGAAAGQDVFHVHLHLIPRFAEDGFGFVFPPSYRRLPARSILDAQAEDIRLVLAEI